LILGESYHANGISTRLFRVESANPYARHRLEDQYMSNAVTWGHRLPNPYQKGADDMVWKDVADRDTDTIIPTR
jgi:hypothetical protein